MINIKEILYKNNTRKHVILVLLNLWTGESADFFIEWQRLTIISRLPSAKFNQASVDDHVSKRSRHCDRTILRSEPAYPTRLSLAYIARYLKSTQPRESVFFGKSISVDGTPRCSARGRFERFTAIESDDKTVISDG